MDWYRRALDLLFPPRCAACRRTGRYLCHTCTPPRAEFIDCPACHHLADGGRIHARCRPLFPLDGLIVYGAYDGPLGAIVREVKYRGVTSAGAELAALLAEATRDRLPEAVTALAPVPMHSARLRERGFNQAELLANELGKRLGLTVVMALERRRDTRPQVGLHAIERRLNLDGAFAPAGKALPQSIALVDDVATTGATLGACAQALRAAGVAEIWGIVVARDR